MGVFLDVRIRVQRIWGIGGWALHATNSDFTLETGLKSDGGAEGTVMRIKNKEARTKN